MRVGRVVIVVGAVKVCRHHGEILGAVLEIERLAHLHAGDFGYRIGFVGVFERGSQQGVFLHWLRSLSRVDAC